MDPIPPLPPPTPSPAPPPVDPPTGFARSLRDPEARSAWARRSVTLKLVAIALLTLVLLVPLLMLRGLISERERLRDAARRDVAASWGAPQAVQGPVLSVPFETPARGENGQILTNAPPVVAWVHVLPDSLTVDGTLTPRVKTRGIFDVVLYESKTRVSARFPALSFDGLAGVTGTPRLDRAILQMGVPDLKGVRDGVRVRWAAVGGDSAAATTVEMASGLPTTDVFGEGVSAPVPVSASATGYTVETTLALNGSSRFDVLPVGKETRVRLRSPWATPSFGGAFLPVGPADAGAQVTPEGFDATWKVLALNRDYPQRFVGRQPGLDASGVPGPDAPYVETANGVRAERSAFGVELKLPVDAYQKAMRTAEYGLLFVLMTFATFFFVEVLGGRRIHPVQYLLVGFAVSLFYLMLLAFAEYLPFDAAYGLAAALILGLVLLYTKAVFREWRLAGLVTGVLAVFYVYFFVLLQLEEYALLAGSLGLFVLLAGVMYLSRKVDWYGLADRPAA